MVSGMLNIMSWPPLNNERKDEERSVNTGLEGEVKKLLPCS